MVSNALCSGKLSHVLGILRHMNVYEIVCAIKKPHSVVLVIYKPTLEHSIASGNGPWGKLYGRRADLGSGFSASV